MRLRAESLGDQGVQWLAGLDEIIGHLESSWAVEVGDVLSGGSESLVAEVLCDDGTVAILKVGLPGSADLTIEAKVFRLAAGRGYANMIAHDSLVNALLLEQLGMPLAKTDSSVDQQIRQICATLHEAWIPLDSSNGLMTGADKTDWLATFISEQWELLDRPCDRRTIDRALLFAEQRRDAHSRADCVLVHGDAHALNTLATPENDDNGSSPYRFVDPDGLYAERACDLAVPMREWNSELLAGSTVSEAKRRCELLAELSAVDQLAIWQWGFIERVSTGLVLLQIGMREEGSEYLTVADRLRNED